nr:hypothetical protein [Tanacetum cinerariifolium]
MAVEDNPPPSPSTLPQICTHTNPYSHPLQTGPIPARPNSRCYSYCLLCGPCSCFLSGPIAGGPVPVAAASASPTAAASPLPYAYAAQHQHVSHGEPGLLGPTPAIYPYQATSLPSALSTMDLQDPTWNMDTSASFLLNSNASNLSTIFNQRLFSSVHVGEVTKPSTLPTAFVLLVPPLGTNVLVIPAMKCFISLLPVISYLVIKRSLHMFPMLVNLWHNAMYGEYNALVKNGTWTLSRCKARLVTNGSSQQLCVDFDETFSPIVKPATIHTVLSLVVSQIFIWTETSTSYLVSEFYRLGSQVAYLLLYVDDIILTASSTALLQHLIVSLHREFDMIDLGALNYFLGISYVRHSTCLFLSQRKYALQLLERAHMGMEPHRGPSRAQEGKPPSGGFGGAKAKGEKREDCGQ